MRKNNEEVSLHELKRHIEELKRRNMQKKQMEKKLGEMSDHAAEDDYM